ncbi:MAG TPA: hypothetical protein VGN23_14595 [Verrucomicrobiae bacterium]|jgi:hypothetical protein
MKTCHFLSVLVTVLAVATFSTKAGESIPLVYNVENSGANYPAPSLPPLGSLPYDQILPDPFLWTSSYLNTNWSGRSTSFADWEHHRSEIIAEIENYEIGTKPAVDLSQVTASFTNNDANNGVLTVTVTVGTNILTLTCPVTHPSTNGIYPVCIGMNEPYGSLRDKMFTSRNIVGITFVHNQVTTYYHPQNTDPFFKLYGPAQNIHNTGQYAAWAWGISRVIDGLYKLNGNLGGTHIDLSHIAVTGCSYAGKMALISGALDERVALTVAQESGGGGANSWRYNHYQTNKVEDIDNTDYQWFSQERLRKFAHDNVYYLPEDHHELDALVAPRALFLTGNTNYLWLGNPSCFVCSMAAQQVYQTLGIEDRFGFNVDGGHQHCFFPNDQTNDLAYFLDKFMSGQTNLSKVVASHPPEYATIDYAKWYAGWGVTNTLQ